MNFKNQLLGLAAVSLIALSSCKKDLVAPEQAVDAASVSSDAVAANDVAETAPPVYKIITTSSVIPNSDGYIEVLPARYSLTTKSYPLILFIHGIGELGSGVSRVTCCGLPSYVAKKAFPAEFVVNGQHFSYIVIAPQFKVRPTPADMQNYINAAVKKYRVDPTRIYITGLSMGGGSAWDYSAVYGQNVAAAVPVCGGTAPSTALAKAVASKNLPVWTISSTADAVVPVSWATNWVNWIKADNTADAANIKLTVYTSGEDHNTTWTKAFNPATKMDGLNIYEWMLKYKRTGAGAPVPPPSKPTAPSKPAAPTAPTAGTPVARAGADITIHKFWNYAPQLNGTLSTIPGGWWTTIAWSYISGPKYYKFENAGAIQTRISDMVVGTYTFRLNLKANNGKIATDDIKVIVLP